MSLLATIKADQLKARKAKDADTASFLTTLYSEAAMVGKNDGDRETTDAEVLNVADKFRKNIVELLGLVAAGPARDKAQIELDLLTHYLPKTLTNDEIKEIVVALGMAGRKEDPTFMKTTMAYFKTEYANRYDGKALAGIVGAVIKGE